MTEPYLRTSFPSEVVDFPRVGADGKPVCQVAISVLSAGQSAEVHARAKKRTDAMMDKSTGEKWSDVYNDILGVELVAAVCRRPDDASKPFFSSYEAVAENLTAAEVGVLLVHYASVVQHASPVRDDFADMESRVEWLRTAAQTNSLHQLRALSVSTLVDMLEDCARQLHG